MLWELRPPRASRRGATTASATSRAAHAADAADAADATTAHAVGGHLEGVLDMQFARLSVGRGEQAKGSAGEGRRREAVASPSIAPGSEDRANPRKSRVPRAPFGSRDSALHQ